MISLWHHCWWFSFGEWQREQTAPSLPDPIAKCTSCPLSRPLLTLSLVASLLINLPPPPVLGQGSATVGSTSRESFQMTSLSPKPARQYEESSNPLLYSPLSQWTCLGFSLSLASKQVSNRGGRGRAQRRRCKFGAGSNDFSGITRELPLMRGEKEIWSR